MGLSFKVIHKT